MTKWPSPLIFRGMKQFAANLAFLDESATLASLAGQGVGGDGLWNKLFAIYLCFTCTIGSIQASETWNRLEWNTLPPFPDELGVAGPFAGVHNNSLILAGGANFPRPVWDHDKVWHNRIHVLIKKGNDYTWRDGGLLPRPTAYGAAVSTSDGIVCMGGNDKNNTLDDVYLLRWDPKAGQVTLTGYPRLPKPCAYGQATVVGNIIYLAGGQSDQGLETAMRNFWALDLAKQKDADAFVWRELPPWPGSARAFNITAHQQNGDHDCVYVISGRRKTGDEVTFLKDVWEFSPPTHQWRRCADAPRCRMAGLGIDIGHHHLLILGGADGSLFHEADALKDRHPGFPKEALAYHPITDTWTSAGPIPQNHVTTIPVWWDGKIIIPSGELRPRVRSATIWCLELVE
ncbi:MAG: hypothetical protein JW829_05420 [Pirellulales bacterium]|nr:hypothetical protein [Pirellulales bacterium]